MKKNTKDTNIETLLLVACNVCKREKKKARKNEGLDEGIEFLCCKQFVVGSSLSLCIAHTTKCVKSRKCLQNHVSVKCENGGRQGRESDNCINLVNNVRGKSC